MKRLLVTLAAGLCCSFIASATTVQYSLSATANPDEYVVLFTTDAMLAQNQALVVKFPYSSTPPSFTSLQNPIGGIGYNLYFHQPNNPSGTAGDVTIIRSSVGTGAVPDFSIEATYVTGSFPGTLPFEIWNFSGSDSLATVVGNAIETGNATSAPSGVPEPSSFALSMIGLAVAGRFWSVRRK